MQTRSFGNSGLEVSALGLGCMGMSWSYGPPKDKTEMIGLLHTAEEIRTVTHHVQGSNTRDKLVGRDLPRRFEFTANGQLVIRSTNPDEHWSVTWEHG